MHRPVPLRELKLANSDTMEFTGYGAVFNNVDSYGDVIVPGAFARSLREQKSVGVWPAMLGQHGGWGIGADDLMPLGVWTSIEEDTKGLKVHGRLADTARGREAYGLLKMDPRPALDGLSIGYIPKKWTARTKPEEPRRKLEDVELLEISLVTFPANPQARVAEVKSKRNLERLLMQDAGLSRSEVRALLSGGYDAMQDAGDDQADALRRLISIIKG